MNKNTKDSATTSPESKDKKPRLLRKSLCAVLAALLVFSAVFSLLGKSTEAYAGTTGTGGDYYQLYDSSTMFSHISHLRVDGNSAFCVEFDSEFVSGTYVSKHDAADIYGQALVTRIALYRDYIYSISWLNENQRYFIAQTLVWETLNPGSFPGGLRVDMGVSGQDQTNIKNEAIAYYNKYKNSYVGRGTYWNAGAAQDLAEFWVERHTLGSINLKKESSNPAATTGNSRYSLAGAIYTIYNADNKAVGTLSIDANGDSNTVSNLWAGEFGTYYVKETKAPQGYERNTTTYTVNLTGDGQTITVRAKDEPILGRIELTKSSANPDITNGNDCYRLNGAQYGVFGSESNAKSLTSSVATITTNNAGYGTAENLPLGEYWVREVKAPEGYTVDETIYYVDITTAKTTVQVASTDKPKNDPVAILLNKADSDTGIPYAGSASATLGEAQFTIHYYDAQHATVADAQADTPTRSWVIRTDADGYALLDPDYLVSGDPLYSNSAGDATIPIGSFTIQETKAPVGYLLSTPTLPNAIRLFHITDDGSDGEFLYVYNAPEVREQIIRGDIVLVKYQEDEVTTPDLPSELKTPEVGVTFDLYASRDFTGTTPRAGAVPALSLTTNADGAAASADTGLCVLQWPDGTYTARPRTPTDSGTLPFDIYLVIQCDAPYGYSPANRFTVNIAEDMSSHTYIIGNTLIPAAIRIEKVDSETGVTVPYLAKWQVLDASTNEPITMTIHYPKTQVLDTFESSADGWLLLPEMLPMGNYLLHEVEAPATSGIGYLLNPVDVPFEVTERYEWDSPLIVTCKDAPAKGQIALIKYDALDGLLVGGATYTIYAAEDIYTLDGTLRASVGDVVDTLITSEDGKVISSELYLGSYVVKETATPDGFALNASSYPVELIYQGQTVAVNVEDVFTTDKPTTLRILKVDAASGKPLAGVTFAVTATEGTTTELVTEADGTAIYPYLPKGTYTVYETTTAPGYIVSDEVVEITVDENGLINGQDSLELLFTNDFTKVLITKTDIVTGEPVIGATLQIFKVDAEGNIAGEPLYEWITTEDAFYIERLVQGDYILREHTAPAGYVIAQDIPFKVSDTGEIQLVEMQDDFTRLEILKTDAKTGKPLAGATLQIIDADGKVVYEWVSEGKPYVIERIAQGSYTLHEVSAPAGYELAKDVFFTVADTAEVQQLSMSDALTPTPTPDKLDQTGRDGSVPYAAAGLFVLLGLGGILFAVRNIRKKKDEGDEGDSE